MKMCIVATTCFNDRPGTVGGGANRADNFVECARSWRKHLKGAEGWPLLISDDDSPRHLLRAVERKTGADDVTIEGARAGVGGSLNRALHFMKGAGYDGHFYAQDDWLLTEDYDLTGPMALLETGVGMVRLGPPHPFVAGEFKLSEHGWYMDLWSEKGGFVYGQRPALYRNDALRRVGLFKEGVSALECEQDYNERWCDAAGWSTYWLGPSPWTPLNGELEELGDVVP